MAIVAKVDKIESQEVEPGGDQGEIQKEFPSAEAPIPEPKVGVRGFRFAAKKVTLTYSQVPRELSPEYLLEKLKEQFGIEEYIIGTEEHKNGGKHYHVVLILGERLESRNPHVFDVEFEGKPYHPCCQSVRNLPSALQYAKKGGEFITNMDISEKVNKGLIARELLDMSSSEGIDNTLRHYMKKYTDKAISSKNLLSVEKVLKRNEALNRHSKETLEEATKYPV